MSIMSIASDVNGDTGDPAYVLGAISDAGFEDIHFCQYQGTRDLLTPWFVADFARKAASNGLTVADLHGSDGSGLWGSTYEHEIELMRSLIRNRMEVAAELGGKTMVIHAPVEPSDPAANEAFWNVIRSDLVLMERWSEELGVKIGLEQTGEQPRNWPTMKRMLNISDPRYVGMCWDVGHGHLHSNNEEMLKDYGERINSTHLCSNMGPQAYPEYPDYHMLPYDGTLPFDQNLELLAATGYRGPMTLEVTQRKYRGVFTLTEYLARAYQRACRMVETYDDLIGAA